LSGTGSVTGNATLNGGTINFGSGGSIGGTLDVTGGSWNGLGSVTGLITSSSGTFTIGSGANLTANGDLDITGGTLAAGDSSSTITGNVNYTSPSNSLFAGIIAGSGKTLTLNNPAATLTLTGANTYTGGTTITSGTLQIGSNGPTGNLGSGNVVNNGTLAVSRSNTITISNDISGSGVFNQIGAGRTILTGNNSYTGGTNINNGVLNLGSANAIGTTGTISFGGGTLQYSASNQTDYSARFSNAASQAYNIDTNGQNVTFATGLTSSGGTFTKLGTGTLALNAVNSYTGATTANAGSLLVNGSTSSSSTVAVNNNGTTLGGTGTIGGAVNVNAGAVINPGPQGADGTSASVGTLTTGALTLAGTATFHTDAFGTATSEWDKVVVNGSASLGSSTLEVIIASGLSFNPGDTYTLVDANAISGTFSGIADNSFQTFSGYQFIAHYDFGGDGNFELVAVPEPGTWFAAVLTLVAIGFSQRKRLRACALSIRPQYPRSKNIRNS